MTLALTVTAVVPVIKRDARAIRSDRITGRNGGVGTGNYFRPGPGPGPGPAPPLGKFGRNVFSVITKAPQSAQTVKPS
jgi:hypothetical protein